MRRAPIVMSATVAGVAAVLSFHAHPQKLTPAASAPAATGSSSGASSTRSTPSTRKKTAASRTAVGAVSQNQYGNVQVKVTVKGGKITDVTPLQLPESDGKSAAISQYAAPQLQSQVMTAQSAQIDGVSGASYTSQSYDTSLQSALDQLGFHA